VNKTVVNVTYVNQRQPGAVMATTPQAFTSAQSVSRNSVRVNATEVASAPVGYSAPAVAPSRQAVLGSGVAATRRPPAAIQARAVVAKTAPPPPPPSFAKQQQAIQANGGRPIAVSQMRQIQPEATQVHANIRVAPVATAKPIQARGVQPNNSRPVAPTNAPANAVNRQGNPTVAPAVNPPAANANGNAKTYADRPPTSRPNVPANTTNAAQPANVNPQLEQKHQQQIQDLRNQQDLERQKVEQQQQKDKAALDKKAEDTAAQQKLNQQHQQQLETLEKKHDTEEAKLKQQQQTEKKNAPKPPAKPPKDDKPPKKDK